MDECFVTDSANKMLMSVFNKGDIDSEKTSELIDKSTSLNDGLPKNIITPVVLNGKQMYMITGNGDLSKVTFQAETNISNMETALKQEIKSETYSHSVQKGKNRESEVSSAVLSLSNSDCEIKGNEINEIEMDDGDDIDEDETKDNQSQVVQTWFTSKDHKNAVHSDSHVWKKGQWTKEEISLLHANISEYCQNRGISSAKKVIFEMSKDERKDFYRIISRGLNRPLFNIYRRVIRMYDSKNYVGKYTAEEVQKLQELRALYGNDWAVIGNELGRSAASVKDRCRSIKDNCHRGHWSIEEENRLIEAVNEIQQAIPEGNNQMLGSSLSWAAVAEKVGSRTEKQCRAKWLNQLSWKERGGQEWCKSDDLMLVKKLKDLITLGIKEETEINWVVLSQNWESVRSPQWLHNKWWSLKHNISGYNSMLLADLVDAVENNLSAGHVPKRSSNSQNGVVILNNNTVATTINLPVQVIPLQLSNSADVNPGDLSFGDECQFIQDSSLGNSTILLAQPTNQGFVAFTAEGLATAGSFLLGSLAGSGLKTMDISMLHSNSNISISSTSEDHEIKDDECTNEVDNEVEQVLLTDIPECDCTTVIVSDSVDCIVESAGDETTNVLSYALDPVYSEEICQSNLD